MLSIRVRNWCVCSACASGPDAYASLRYCQFLKSTNSLHFANLVFGNNYVRFASLDSQVNVNFLRFASIFKFLTINMFASLQNNFFTIQHVRFASLDSQFELTNVFASLQIFKFFNINMFASLRNTFFTIQHVRFASLDSQFNINLLRFASIFKFFNIWLEFLFPLTKLYNHSTTLRIM
jgi:hypothetical protein